MLFKKNYQKNGLLGIGLEDWHRTLSDQDRVRLGRYEDKASYESASCFFFSVIDLALAEENYTFAVKMCQDLYGIGISEYEAFLLNERLIDAYIGAARYDDAKAACLASLDIFPRVEGQVRGPDGSLPETLNCRNRLIDVMVGIESDYDGANAMLDRFVTMGFIDAKERDIRKNSLKIHRLQRTFDGIYTYRPKE